jgi:predicted kinase
MAKKIQKPTLTMLKGLPASGKSTYAEEMVILEERTARVNKDKIREMCACMAKSDKKRRDWAWEEQFQEAEFAVAKIFLLDGFNVVVDDTNLKPYHEEAWKAVAYSCKANFVVKSFLDVPVETCCERDALRAEPVGRGVIYGLASMGGLIKSANEKVTLEGKFVVVDMDGTLSNPEKRLHYIQNGNANWEKFFEEMVYDEVNDGVRGIIEHTYAGLPVVVVTGRPEPYRILCSQWLDFHDIKYHSILMRKAEDKRPDDIVKQEILDEFLPKDQIEVVIDDRASVLRMWRNNGLRIINVGGPNNEY